MLLLPPRLLTLNVPPPFTPAWGLMSVRAGWRHHGHDEYAAGRDRQRSRSRRAVLSLPTRVAGGGGIERLPPRSLSCSSSRRSWGRRPMLVPIKATFGHRLFRED